MKKPKERALVLTTKEVKGFLSGQPGQIIRPAKPRCNTRPFVAVKLGEPYPYYYRRCDAVWDSFKTVEEMAAKYCPCGKPGDLVWVRETWYPLEEGGYAYKADKPDGRLNIQCWEGWAPWKPSTNMPRAASRLQLEVTSVQIEPQDKSGWNWIIGLKKVALETGRRAA